MEMKDEIGRLITEALEEGRTSAEIVQTLAPYIEQGDITKPEILIYIKIWQQSEKLQPYPQFNLQRAWVRVGERILHHSAQVSRLANLTRYAIGAAATAALLIGLAFALNLFAPRNNAVSVSTRWGHQAATTLPDGSLVRLNAGSSITFRANPLTGKREVDFSGEGYFEVAKSNKPFVVSMKNGVTLSVLGTKFNLKAYDQEEKFQAALVEGKVELRNRSNEKIELKPGQIGEYDILTGKLTVAQGQVKHLCSWINDKLYMDNMSLAELCRILERKFNVQIKLTKPEMGTQIHYTGVLREETIADVLAVMKQLSGIEYTVQGSRIEITGKRATR